MVTIGTVELPNCHMTETVTIDTNVLTSVGPGNVIVARRKLAYSNQAKQFTIQLLTKTQRDDLVEYLETNQGTILTFDTGPSPLGTFSGLLMQDPLQIVEVGNHVYDVSFKVMVQGG